MSDGDEALDAAWAALEEGDAEGALEAAAAIEEPSIGLCTLRASAMLELGDPVGAYEACDAAEELGGGDDPDVLWTRSEVALALWQVEQAGELLERVLEQGRAPQPLERLALVRDLQGRFDDADLLHAEAFELAPEEHPLPGRLTEEAFDAVVGEACAGLPAPFRTALESLPIVIEPVPPVDLVVSGDPLATPPDLLGLFVGANQLEATDEDPEGALARVYLFQRNLERVSGDPDETREQVRVTLFHELGHYLGFDEEGVEDMGLG